MQPVCRRSVFSPEIIVFLHAHYFTEIYKKSYLRRRKTFWAEPIKAYFLLNILNSAIGIVLFMSYLCTLRALVTEGM
jgi:hypothetical protein